MATQAGTGTGRIVGAALIAHVPPLVLPEAVRLEMNDGRDFTIVEGLHRLRRERLEGLQPDTIIVLDTHWFTTFEWVVTAHDRRAGRFTSEELPRGNPQMPYDLPGDPALAHLIAQVASERADTWVHASEDPCLAIHYPTVYLTPFLQGEEAWLSIGICQTATFDDFMIFGQVLAEAIRRSGKRVVILASGGLSHKFWPLREIRDHEGADLRHIIDPEHRAADEQVIQRLESGDHAAVLRDYPNFRRFSPEGRFAHYVIMAAAMGGEAWKSPGVAYSDYESAAGTGQIHMWFPCD
ncbi:MAG: catechol 1,2-dioxygenase [Actinomycetia bacterium]|nr:catechol 1,2-dioxygenase [Actinomycetes bacterium]